MKAMLLCLAFVLVCVFVHGDDCRGTDISTCKYTKCTGSTLVCAHDKCTCAPSTGHIDVHGEACNGTDISTCTSTKCTGNTLVCAHDRCTCETSTGHSCKDGDDCHDHCHVLHGHDHGHGHCVNYQCTCHEE